MRHPSLLAPALTLALLYPGTAPGYKVTLTGTGAEAHWLTLPMKFNIHQSPAPGVTAAATQQAVRAAYAAWTGVSCTTFKTQDLGVVNLPQGDKTDHINTHVWPASWPAPNDPNAIALTFTILTSTGISDADTHYNPTMPWSTTGAAKAYDVQAVATHEIGHQLGLDHSPVSGATMGSSGETGDTSPRSLGSDDMAGLCHLYPNGKPVPPECTTTASCAPNETCVSNQCVRLKKGYGEACTSNDECTSQLCINFYGKYLCSQLCTSQTCPNQDQCMPLVGGDKACVPSTATGKKGLGETCATPGDCQSNICVEMAEGGVICSQSCVQQPDNCPSHYVCVKSSLGPVCVFDPSDPPGKKQLGDPCTANSDCVSNLCVQGAGAKVCSSTCDPSKTGACPAGFACTAQTGAVPVCLRPTGSGDGGGAGGDRPAGLDAGVTDGGQGSSDSGQTPGGGGGCAVGGRPGGSPLGELAVLALCWSIICRRRRPCRRAWSSFTRRCRD